MLDGYMFAALCGGWPMPLDRRITLHKLEVFELVVEHQSVSRAAEHLFVAQPVVSAHIRSLEERVGAKLFYREGRQLQLTEAGHTVHRWAIDVLTHTRELSRQLDGLSDGSRGSVLVAASMSIGSYILPTVLGRFRRERPQVEIRLDIIDSDLAIRATEAGECDFAIVFAEQAPPNRGLAGERIGEERLVMVAAPDGEPRADSVTVDEIRRLEFVDSQRGHIGQRLINDQLKRIGVDRRKVVMHLGHPEAIKRGARDGLGCALLFDSAVAEDIAGGTLRRIEIRDVDLAIPIYVVYRKGKLFSATQRDLLAAIRESLDPATRRPALNV
jgi:DNA-binding transcriptional LysR family regulator